jgi:hypothetical protein
MQRPAPFKSDGKYKGFFALFAKISWLPGSNMKYTVLIFCCALTTARPPLNLPYPAAASGLPGRTSSPLSAQATNDTLPQSLADRKAAFGFFDSVFARPSFLFARLEPGLPAGMDTILLRFNTAVAANRQWFNAYKDKYAASGQQLPYDPHFGITYMDYRRILELAHAPIRLAPADSQLVTVLREGGLVHFRSAGEDHLLDYLLVDPGHQQLLYGGDTIPFAGLSDPGLASRIGLIATGDTTHSIPDAGRTTGTPSIPATNWQGYSWRLEKTDIATGIAGLHVAARVVQIDLGLSQGQTNPLIRIHYEQLKADSTVSGFDLVGFIH